MRRFLPFAALFGVAFVLGCQDVGTGVVESDGAGPQFGVNCDDKPNHPKCPGGAGGGGGGGGGVKGKVTLGPLGGMATSDTLRLPGGIDATKIGLNTNTHAGTITMNFKTDVDDTDDQVCTDYTGEEGRRDKDLVLCSQSLFRFADLGDDGLCRGGPDKGCGVIVSAIDVVVDRLD